MHHKLKLVQYLLLYTFSFTSHHDPWKIIKVLVLIVQLFLGTVPLQQRSMARPDQLKHLPEKVSQNLILLCKTFCQFL